VVVPVMFHSIVQSGRAVTDPKDISEEQFQAFVQAARYLGFSTITTAQLIGFLEENAPIPPRSMILILDDRRPGVVRDHFLPVLEANDWTLTLAYIADPNSAQWAMVEVQRLAAESGRLDVQSHGYSGQLYIVEQTPRLAIQAEIWDSTLALQANFGIRPLALIWPGGNFNTLAVQIAREGGYRLGFTAYSRGPLMFNWVPQGEPEQAVADPLMLLPRAWSNSVNVNLDEALKISEQAVAFARQQYPQEAEYYRTYCAGILPPLEQILGE
jgi:peptidoglycan/xylan/chitin deacetylase (PgdA/CDA1 family)